MHPWYRPQPCAANAPCHEKIRDLKQLNGQLELRIDMAGNIAEANYEAYSREKTQFQKYFGTLEQLKESIQVLDAHLSEDRRERMQLDYATVIAQRDGLEQKAKQLEGDREELRKENAQLKQFLSQGRKEGGVPQVSVPKEGSTKRKRAET
jgi:chromosome segregation ATPase